MNRFARQTGTKDANHDVIVRELRDRGCTVVELERPVDIVIGRLGVWTFCEIKTGPGAEVKPTQSSFLAECHSKGLPCILIDDLDDVDAWFPMVPDCAPAATAQPVKISDAQNP